LKIIYIADQQRRKNVKISDYWQSDPVMAPREYARVLLALGLNQSSAARFFGYSARTSRRFLAGEAEVPPATVMLMRLLVQLGLRPKVRSRKAKRRAVVAGHPAPPSP
jgi:hypothetical protein